MPQERPYHPLESLTEFGDTQLDARVIKDGVAYSGEVIHNDLRLFVVNFQRHQRPSFPLTESVILELDGEHLPVPIRTPAKVIYRRQADNLCLYQLELEEEIDPLDHDVLTRRRAPRVQPTREERIPVELRSPDGRTAAHARLFDISTLGVAVVLHPNEERLLYNAWELDLRFDLPGTHSKTLEFRGTVCYRRLVDDGVHYGIEFTPAATVSYEKKLGVIERFVNGRRPELQDIRHSA